MLCTTESFKGGGRNPYTLGPEVCGGQHLHISIGNHPIDLTLSLGSDPGRYCISMVNIIVKKHRNHSDFTQILPNLAEMRPYTMYFGFPLSVYRHGARRVFNIR